MATSTFSVRAPRSIGQWAIESDGLMCVASGGAFILVNEPISRFLGIVSPAMAIGIGVVAFVYGLFLLYRAMTDSVNRWLLQLAITLDVIWVIGTIVLLVAAPNALTTEGRWVVLIAGDIVAALGVWQYMALRRTNA